VSILGTDMQEIFDSFFAKIPDVDFTGKETLLFKLLKTSIGYCYKTVPESLEYIYDEVINEGKFTNVLFLDTIELLSLCMTREYYFRELDKLSRTKQHIGTQAFNKLPDLSKQYDTASENYKNIDEKFYLFRQEFYTYKG
jgi:hypothetical protein